MFWSLSNTQFRIINIFSDIFKDTPSMAETKSYSNYPRTIFGLKRSDHRAFLMPKVLSYYKKPLKKGASKKVLLCLLGKLEYEVSGKEHEVIHNWLTAKKYSEGRLCRNLNSARGIKNEPEHPSVGSDSDDDQPLFTQPLIECSACLQDLHHNNFPEQRITELCAHDPTTCKECVTRYVDTQIPILNWDQLQCPDCRVPLPYDVVKRWASSDAFEKYENPSLGNIARTIF